MDCTGKVKKKKTAFDDGLRADTDIYESDQLTEKKWSK